MAIVITDEMRAAVLAELGETCVHVYDMRDLIGSGPPDPDGLPRSVVRARDDDRLPHLRCRRCGRVWLVIDTDGVDYDDAVAKAAQRMDRPDRFTPRPLPGPASGPSSVRPR